MVFRIVVPDVRLTAGHHVTVLVATLHRERLEARIGLVQPVGEYHVDVRTGKVAGHPPVERRVRSPGQRHLRAGRERRAVDVTHVHRRIRDIGAVLVARPQCGGPEAGIDLVETAPGNSRLRAVQAGNAPVYVYRCVLRKCHFGTRGVRRVRGILDVHNRAGNVRRVLVARPDCRLPRVHRYLVGHVRYLDGDLRTGDVLYPGLEPVRASHRQRHLGSGGVPGGKLADIDLRPCRLGAELVPGLDDHLARRAHANLHLGHVRLVRSIRRLVGEQVVSLVAAMRRIRQVRAAAAQGSVIGPIDDDIGQRVAVRVNRDERRRHGRIHERLALQVVGDRRTVHVQHLDVPDLAHPAALPVVHPYPHRVQARLVVIGSVGPARVVRALNDHVVKHPHVRQLVAVGIGRRDREFLCRTLVEGDRRARRVGVDDRRVVRRTIRLHQDTVHQPVPVAPGISPYVDRELSIGHLDDTFRGHRRPGRARLGVDVVCHQPGVAFEIDIGQPVADAAGGIRLREAQRHLEAAVAQREFVGEILVGAEIPVVLVERVVIRAGDVHDHAGALVVRRAEPPRAGGIPLIVQPYVPGAVRVIQRGV